MQSSPTDPQALTRIRDALNVLMPAWQPDLVEACDYLSGGYSNDNYRFDYGGDEYVIRLPGRERSFIDRRLERQFLENHQNDLSIAEFVALDETTGNLLTRFVSGTLLADAEPSLEKIAAYLRKLHAALPESRRPYDPYRLSREYLAEGNAPIPLRKLAVGPWEPAQLASCHNDLNPWNIIEHSQDHWVTLDWEWLGQNDPLFDLVTLHQGLALDDRSLHTLIELWQQEPLAAGRLESCLIAFWLREFAWAWAERHHGNAREEIEAQIQTSRDKLAGLVS